MLFFGSHGDPASAAKAGAAKTSANLGLGHHAVIVFFVLSGFLVGGSAWRSISRGRWSWRNYLSHRLTRLWIVLVPALLIGGAIDVVGLHLMGSGHSIYDSPAGQTMITGHLSDRLTVKVVAGNLLFLQTIRVPTSGTNAALWSLANEFWYYLIFPALGLAFYHRRSVSCLAYLLGAALLLWLIGPEIRMLFPIWLLGFGISRVAVMAKGRLRMGLSLFCLLQFTAVNWIIRTRDIPNTLGDLLLGISFSALLYALLQYTEPCVNSLYERVATFFARFSYTAYLVHLPVLTLLTAVLLHPWAPMTKTPRTLLLACLLVCASYLYAYVFSLFSEAKTDALRDALGFEERKKAVPQFHAEAMPPTA